MSRKSSHTECRHMKNNFRNKNVNTYRYPALRTVDITPGDRKEVELLSQGFARKLLLPKPGPKKIIGFMKQEKLEQLQKAAATKINEEEAATKAEQIKLREQLQKEQEARRAEFETWDLMRKKNEKLTELEEEAKQKMEYLREKANEAIREQNEEIKEINKLILSAKIQAIRDAQVEEKKHIKKKHAMAEADLDEIMERERREGVLKERDIEERRKEAAYRSAAKLQEQIKENLERRLLDEERKIKEGEILLKKLKEDQMREYQEMKNKQLKKQVILEELTKANEEQLKRKQIMKEQSEREDKIIAEYQRLKAAQDEAKEAAEKEAKLKRELELARMGEIRGKASDLQAEQEALRARRAQEQKEREYRRKEKEAALKKKQLLQDLKKCRAEQLQQQERLRQIKAEAEIKELEALLKKIKEETKQEERKALMKKLENLKHLEELKNQIQKKEVEKINEKRESYNEGIHLQQEEKRRHEMLEVLKKEKLQDLRKYNIPETYINHIKRKVNLEE
ncbi:Coiled-coil domain-containing protein 19, mitochondrial, partial [Stegodyphus mimosarum]